MNESQSRRVFAYLNRYLMVPMFRLGFGALMGNPFTGYIMVLKTIGRKSGKMRYAPVNYAIADGCVYCVAGFGKTSDWYRNLIAHPQIELLMPSGAITGTADRVEDDAERARVIRQILINAGFAGFFYGYNPRTISDESLREQTQDVPLIRFRPVGIGSSAYDAGGWAWLWVYGSIVALIAWLINRRKN